MLPVSTLKLDERLKIGKDLSIMVVQIRGKQVKIGIDSPLTCPRFEEHLRCYSVCRKFFPQRG